MSIGKFFKTDGLGNIFPIKGHSGWRGTWHVILPVTIGGGTAHTDLFFYDRTAGEAKFFRTDGQGNLEPVKHHDGLRKTWDIIVPGNFGGDGNTDLMFYDRAAGEVKFFTTDSAGNLIPLSHHKDWRTTWDIIVPGDFAISGNTGLMCYDRAAGEAEFYKLKDAAQGIKPGDVELVKRHTGWRKSWHIIVPGDFSLFGVRTDLLFYDRINGEGKFYQTDQDCNLIPIKPHIGWRKTWDIIVPGDFGGNSKTDLLFYDRAAGEAKFFKYAGEGNLEKLEHHKDLPAWAAIVPGTFESTPPHTDLLFYEQTLNHAAYFGWRGYADTDLKFSEFFSSDHTVMARFMLQHPIAYAGPILAENGSGRYFIGQGNYDSSQNGPKLVMQIGSKAQEYLHPALVAGKWLHLAVVRSGNTFKLYLNGTKLSPDITINSSDNKLPDGNSILRLGRRTDGGHFKGYEAQFYGFIDDVAVFKKALTQPAISNVVNESDKRLDGDEPDLLAGWTFDWSKPNGGELPPVLKRPITFGSAPNAPYHPAGNIILSQARDDGYDAALLPEPIQQVELQLPIPAGETWRMVAGNSAPKPGTHNCWAAFSFDFGRIKPYECTGSVRAAASGPVKEVIDSTYEKGNTIRVEHAPNEIGAYKHNLEDSAEVQVGDTVKVGQELAQVGKTLCHVHFNVRNKMLTDSPEDIEPVDIPVAFRNYEACDAQNGKDCTLEENWYKVSRGVPLNNQWVRRPID